MSRDEIISLAAEQVGITESPRIQIVQSMEDALAWMATSGVPCMLAGFLIKQVIH